MSSQEITQRTPDQQLIARVREPMTREQLEMALPPTVTVERFIRVMTSAIIANPDIAKLDHTSVLRAMVQSAAMGLIPDGKQAAITPRGGQAVLVPMIQGFRDIAADHGWTLRTAVVYANDEFRHAVIDGEESLFHAPVRPGADRGELIAAYAIAKHRDGRRMQVVLHPDDIAKRRASASTQNVWNSHPAAMWEKSAGRDLFAQLGFGELDERVTAILEASRTEPAEAARLIYGAPVNETPAQLPAGTDAPLTERTTTSPPPPAEQSDVGATQQAAAAPSPVAAAAPGSDDVLDGEPGPVQESAFQPPAAAAAAAEEDPVVYAARFAGDVVVPIGQWQGHTLKQVHEAGDAGTRWFKYALGQLDDTSGTTEKADPKMRPGELIQAVYAFSRVYLPDEYQAAMAAKALKS